MKKLYLLDAYDFARFMRRFNSSNKSAHYRTFTDPSCWTRAATRENLDVMQWQNAKAMKRTAKASLPVVR